MPITCFFCEPTEKVAQYLRRFVRSSEPARSTCAVVENQGYHQVWSRIEDLEQASDEKLVIEDKHPHDDVRWPTHCTCGCEFVESDQWQLFFDRIYRRTDTREEFPLRDVPVGAMWYADWMGHWRGPDGHSLMVRTPGGDWPVDIPESGTRGSPDAKGWERTGIPPKVTARPSIGIPDGSGGFRYHGFLTDGVLNEC